MVASRNTLPLIQNPQGVTTAFASEWLEAALDRAARRAGYESWWLVGELSAAVSMHLQQNYPGSVIALPELGKVVRTALRAVGYHEIALRFRVVDPFQCMSLAECLKAPGTGRQRLFFKRLVARIASLHAAKVQNFHFCDLDCCMQTLLEGSDPSWWSRSLLRAHIVGLIRDRILALSWKGDLQCTIR